MKNSHKGVQREFSGSIQTLPSESNQISERENCIGGSLSQFVTNDSEVTIRLLSSGKFIGLSGITDELKRIAEESDKLFAAVAYVTVIPSSLSKLLREGFLCADVHPPTSIDKLDSAFDDSIPVYLHLKRVRPANASKGHNHLLHSKLLLFESAKKATIIVGSHNWTSRAIPGINIEDSVVVEVPLGHELHDSVKAQLRRIRTNSHQFNKKDVPLYRAIQQKLYSNNLNDTVTITNTSKHIPSGSDIVIFGDDFDNYTRISDLREIIIQIQQKSNPADFQTYDATIIRSGRLPKSDSRTKNEEFFSVYYASWKPGSKIPEIMGQGVPPSSVNTSYNYFIHLRINNTKNSQILHPLSIPEIWNPTEVSEDFSGDEAFRDIRNKGVRVEIARVDEFAEEWDLEKDHKKILPEEFEFVGKYIVQDDDEQ